MDYHLTFREPHPTHPELMVDRYKRQQAESAEQAFKQQFPDVEYERLPVGAVSYSSKAVCVDAHPIERHTFLIKD
ncbi:hypothetical protein D5018_03780 [Parashewanella curva]|uniref:Uncharacterized protein n=1 Tax=Parashewanella curva TaxID=2338552 RepID=A0A3L8Q026_9GAMM|nr:hypothetical protein [Parashewanella curva]RLV60971.1 hypothetical protein D5018_03780 [Parashewanella curva]